MAVITAPRNAERRKAIRETWLNLERHLRTEVIHFFVVGRKGLHSEVLESLEAESAENRDVLLLPNVEDSFDQLTTKVLATFVQLHKSVDFKYLLKVCLSQKVGAVCPGSADRRLNSSRQNLVSSRLDLLWYFYFF